MQPPAQGLGPDGYPLGEDAQAAYAGKRSEVPMPRSQPPVPLRSLSSTPSAPSPYRNFDIRLDKIDVVYAEDEIVFRESAVRQLVNFGFNKEFIHESDTGLGALEDLIKMQYKGNVTMPLLVLLDIRMPGMDGRECALQIQELVKKKQLPREPFVMCCSSHHQKVVVQEGKGNFQVVLPKPFTVKHIEECTELMKSWWTTGEGRALPAWKNFVREEIDVIFADDEPMSCMNLSIIFSHCGVAEDRISDAEDEDELIGAISRAQDGALQQPLMVVLMRHQWVPKLHAYLTSIAQDTNKRQPFLVFWMDSQTMTKEGLDELEHECDAFLPNKFSKNDVDWCLELLHLWWLTRGPGPPSEPDSDMEQSAPSEASE